MALSHSKAVCGLHSKSVCGLHSLSRFVAYLPWLHSNSVKTCMGPKHINNVIIIVPCIFYAFLLLLIASLETCGKILTSPLIPSSTEIVETKPNLRIFAYDTS